MKAIGINGFGGVERLEILDLQRPEPESGEILVRLMAAGVGPWDIKTREGIFGAREFPHVLGSEGSGVVEEVGGGGAGFSPGDEVYFYSGGGYAEYASVPAGKAARKPSNLSFEEAAAIPVAGVTAYQGLVEEIRLREGETVLITGAAGGVGTLAVQISKSLGARVVGTASERNHDYLRSLGADETLDYNEGDWTQKTRELSSGGVDAVFDCVGGATFDESIEAIKDGGRLVSIAEFRDDFDPGRGISQHAFGARTSREKLDRLTEKIEVGQLCVELQETFPLEDAAKAQERVEAGHVRGKIVLRLS